MKRLALAATALLLLRADMYPDASNAKNPQALNNLFSGKEGHVYYAKAYGNCTWDHTHDVGQCIQLAVDAAALGGGGDVMLPAGKYGMTIGVSGKQKVIIKGAGAGAATGTGATTNCATEIQAITGFSSPGTKDSMFLYDNISGTGMKDMCVDAIGIAPVALSIISVQGSVFDNLRLNEATDASLVIDVTGAGEQKNSTANNQFRNISSRTGGLPSAPLMASFLATACRIGEYQKIDPPTNEDVHSNTFDGLGCYSQDGWSLDLRGADTNRFINTRLSGSGKLNANGINMGTSIFRAGFNTPGALLSGWARNNVFMGLTTDNTLLIEGSDCATAGWGKIAEYNHTLGHTEYFPVYPTCTTNDTPRASRANVVYALKGLGTDPHPSMGKDAGLYCDTTDIGGECGNTSPRTNKKDVPAVQSEVGSTTLTLNDCGTSFNNKGASGADITFTLPLAGVGNCRLEFNRWGAGKITIVTDPTDMVKGDGGTTAAGEGIVSIGTGFDSVTIEAQAPPGWMIKNYTGRWQNIVAGGVSPAPGPPTGERAMTEPVQLATTSFTTGTNFPRSLVLAGGYLYMVSSVSGGDTVLHTIDISNIAAPTELAETSLGLGVSGGKAAARGMHLFLPIADPTNSLRVVDISNPKLPVLVATLSTPGLGGVGAAVAGGNYLYVGTRVAGTFRIYDISVPTLPVQVSTLALTGGGVVNAIVVQGKYAYVARSGVTTDLGRLDIIDISNPAAPTVVGGYAAGMDLYGLAVSGRYAYLATTAAATGLLVVDVADPALPAPITTLATEAAFSTTAAGRMNVAGRYLYYPGATAAAGLQIIDVAAPAAPVLAARRSLTNNNFVTDAEFAGSLLLMTTGGTTNNFKTFRSAGLDLAGASIGTGQIDDLKARDVAVSRGINAIGAVSAGNLYSRGLIAGNSLDLFSGAAEAKLSVACGTTAGTAKLVATAGTSTTPVTVLDNIGAGVSGC